MAQVTPQLVKELRDRTGIGMGKCKEALENAGGDIDLAIENLRKAGMASAVKKEGRETKEGTIKTAENKIAENGVLPMTRSCTSVFAIQTQIARRGAQVPSCNFEREMKLVTAAVAN